jgi:hypothetical protein
MSFVLLNSNCRGERKKKRKERYNQWLRQYDEQQMTDNNMITIDDMT